MKNAQDTIQRLARYLERTKRQAETEPRKEMREFLSREIAKTYHKIEELKIK